MAETVMSKMDPRMLKAINDSTHCANKCIEALNYCVHMGGKYTEPSLVNSLIDCAEVCRVAADATIRGSEFDSQICYLSAVICDRCAESCFRAAPEDGQLRECADMCRICADSCREMANR